MIGRFCLLCALVLGPSSLARAQTARAETPAATQYLLLTNQRVVSGQVRAEADRYVVVMSNGQIRLRKSDVRAVFNSLEDIYECLARECGENIHKHLQLAVWCVDYGLINRATLELAEATAIDPGDRRLEFVERRIELAGAKLQQGKTNANEAVKPIDEFTRLVKGLPDGAAERFTNVVQPILVNRCATGGCHGPGSNNGFELERPPATRVQGRPITQHNLQAVLSYIDRQQPLSSAVVKAIMEPHGNQALPVLGERDQAQREHLLRWVASLGRAQPRYVLPSVTPSAPAEAHVARVAYNAPLANRQANRAQASQPQRGAQPPKAQAASASEDDYTDEQYDAAFRSLGAPAGPDEEPIAPKQPPVEAPDELDPELFNRRYSTKPGPPR